MSEKKHQPEFINRVRINNTVTLPKKLCDKLGIAGGDSVHLKLLRVIKTSLPEQEHKELIANE